MSKSNTIQTPLIWLSLTQQAYINYKNIYNESVEFSARLKTSHHTLFYKLIDNYARSVSNLASKFAGSPYSPVHNKKVEDLPFLEVNTSLWSDYFEVKPQTISTRLKRLEQAGVLKIRFHGHKRPLSISFNTDLLKVIDTQNPIIEVINPNFVTNWNTEAPIGIRQKTEDNKVILTRTYLKFQNKSGVDFFSEKSENEFFDEKKGAKNKLGVQKIQQNTKTVKNQQNLKASQAQLHEHLQEQQGMQVNVPVITIEQLRALFGKQEQNAGGAAAAGFSDFDKAEKIVNEFNNKDNAQAFTEKMLLPIEKRILISRYNYATQFFNYLILKLFADKKSQISQAYIRKTKAYIFENYFRGNSLVNLERNYNEYKYRIDVAADYIKSMSKFDTNLLYPLSYLDVNKTGKNQFSFVNTKKFAVKKIEWQQKKHLAEKIKADKKSKNELEPVKQKFYNICRQFENGRIDYATAEMKIKALTSNPENIVRTFQLRYQAAV